MSIHVLDPTHEAGAAPFVPASRLQRLAGTTIGLISNGKEGTKGFFDAFEKALLDRHGVTKVVRVTKTNYSAPAEPAIMEQAAEWDALVAGIGD